MPIVAVFDFPGHTVDEYREVFEIGGPDVAHQPTRMHHVAFRTGDGFSVVDVWESEEAFAAFGAVLGPALQELGLTAPPKIHPVVRIVTADGTVTDY